MVSVIVRGDQFARRFRVVVVQPQIRVSRNVLTILVAVAVDDDKRVVVIYGEIPVRFRGDCVGGGGAYRTPVHEGKQPDN